MRNILIFLALLLIVVGLVLPQIGLCVLGLFLILSCVFKIVRRR